MTTVAYKQYLIWITLIVSITSCSSEENKIKKVDKAGLKSVILGNKGALSTKWGGMFYLGSDNLFHYLENREPNGKNAIYKVKKDLIFIENENLYPADKVSRNISQLVFKWAQDK